LESAFTFLYLLFYLVFMDCTATLKILCKLRTMAVIGHAFLLTLLQNKILFINPSASTTGDKTFKITVF